MDSPSFEGFRAQLDCKLTYSNKKSNTANTRIVYKVSNKTEIMKKCSQTGITVKPILIMTVSERLRSC